MAGRASVYSTWHQMGQLEGCRLESPNGSLTPVSGDWCWYRLRPQLRLLNKYLYVVCSRGLCFVYKTVAEFQRQMSQEERASEENSITFYELALEIHSIISTTFYLLRQSQVPPKEREHRLHLLMDGQWQVSGRSCGSGNIGMALFGKHILLQIILYIGLSGRLLYR